jgi:hypothetical protein
MGILIFKRLTAQRLCKSFGVKRLFSAVLEAEFHYWAFYAECPVGKEQM